MRLESAPANRGLAFTRRRRCHELGKCGCFGLRRLELHPEAPWRGSRGARGMPGTAGRATAVVSGRARSDLPSANRGASIAVPSISAGTAMLAECVTFKLVLCGVGEP